MPTVLIMKWTTQMQVLHKQHKILKDFKSQWQGYRKEEKIEKKSSKC